MARSLDRAPRFLARLLSLLLGLSRRVLEVPSHAHTYFSVKSLTLLYKGLAYPLVWSGSLRFQAIATELVSVLTVLASHTRTVQFAGWPRP